jgi:hypothetical protein
MHFLATLFVESLAIERWEKLSPRYAFPGSLYKHVN